MGWDNVFHCEIEPFCRKILGHYWPKSKSYEDITKTNFTIHRGQIDILTGGFPCQPFSTAGKRQGTADNRHLWPDLIRAVREIQPRYVVAENVPGLISWNEGMVFEQVQAELENEGYEVQPVVLPACSVNAPHRRDRVWFIAYTKHKRPQRKDRNRMGKSIQSSKYNASDTNRKRQSNRNQIDEKQQIPDIKKGIQNDRKIDRSCSNRIASDTGLQRQAGIIECSSWENFPTQSPICSGNDGISSRLDGITFPKWRNESIKAAGNAIVPNVAYQIFKAIAEMGK